MRKIIPLIIFLLYSGYLNAQTGAIAGTILDSSTNTYLEGASVTIFGKDSALITYQLSDKTGKFFFDKLTPQKEFRLNVSYVGYSSVNHLFTPQSGQTDTLRIQLPINFNDSNNVVVSATIPIRMNGDTLEINPAAFKMKPDAVTEEMLAQVPGVTIWSDGTITVNGKKVKNLYVDGKPFMGNANNKVTTQNLPKDAIDKIQVYEEYDRSYTGTNQKPKDSILTMNIKLKEDKKVGYFGKITAGYGTDNRYETNLSLQAYNKKSSIGIGGGINNINKNIQNLQELFQNNTYRNYNPNLENVGTFGTDGINRNHSFGGVFNHSFIENPNGRQNNRLSLNYNNSGNKSHIETLGLESRTALDNPQFIRNETTQNSIVNKNEIGINYIKTSSYHDNFSALGNASFDNAEAVKRQLTEVRDTTNKLQSSNNADEKSWQKSNAQNLTVSFAKSDGDRPLKNFSSNLTMGANNNSSNRTVNSTFKSYTDATKDTSFNRNYHNNTNNFNISGNFEYSGLKRLLLGRYNLFGIDMSFVQWFNYNNNKNEILVTDFDSAVNQQKQNTRLSNNNRKQTFEYTPYLSLSRNFDKWSEKGYRSIRLSGRLLDDLKAERNISSIAERNLNRSFQFIHYEGDIHYWKSMQNKFYADATLSYAKKYEYPSIDQLYTIVDDINAYDVRIGNPLLKNRTNHNYSFTANYYTQNEKAVYSINGELSGFYQKSLNPTVDSMINDASGKRYYYFVNANKSSNVNLNYNFNISRKFKKNQLQLMYNGAFNNAGIPNYIDQVFTTSKSTNLYNQLNLQFSLRTILVFNLGQTFQNYYSKQSAAGLSSFKNNNRTSKLGITYNAPKNFTISSTVNYITNSNIEKATTLWNAFAAYRFLKQTTELKFSAMDLLKQYRNISNNVTSFGTSTRISNGLQQYFLLSLSYYPRKFGKSVIKQQKAGEVW